MKKRLLSVAFISLSLALSTSLVGCKDYDDDITEIYGNTDDLSKQIAALKEQSTSLSNAAQTAQSTAEQAAAAAQTAKNQGDAAMAQAQAALQAAEQAKADALAKLAEEAQKQADKFATLESLINSSAGDVASLTSQVQGLITDVAALQGKITAIDSKLANVDLAKMTTDLSDALTKAGANAQEIVTLKNHVATLSSSIETLNQFKQAAETQLGALEAFRTSSTAEVSDLKTQITAAEGELTTLLGTTLPAIEARIAAIEGQNLSQDISTVQSELTEVKTELTGINSNISRIDGALSTLTQILSRRLSSLTFVPTSYVDGIPAIDFSSIEYVPMVKTSANSSWTAGTGAPVNVASTDIKAIYRLNPTTVGLEDIVADGISFVDGIATSRAASDNLSLIKVAAGGATIDDKGQLVLNVVKTSDALFNNGLASNEINIVALKVPLAQKHLFSEETEAYVYSEYVRLAEYQLKPQIGKVGEDVATIQFNDSVAAYSANVEAVKVSYTSSQDLLEIANAVLLNKNAWFASLNTPEARAAYGLDLKFHISMGENMVDGVNQQVFGKVEGSTFTPVIPTGYSVQSIPGMTPIVTVTLVDTKNNNVVDQRYIKLELSAEKAAYTIDYPAFASNLFCDNYTMNISWADFQKSVLSKCGNDELGYLTQDEFIKYYVQEGSMTITYGNYAEGAEKQGLTADFVKGADNAITWVVSAEQVGAVKDVKTVNATIALKNETRGTITINLSFIVTYDEATQKPAVSKPDALIWNNETMLIYPSNPAEGGQAEYHTNILTGRTNPYVTKLLSCGGFYMVLDVNGESPATLEFPADVTPYSITAANQGGLAQSGVFFNIANTDQGKAMVEAEETIDMNWNAYLNGEAAGNLVTFQTSKLHILKPLYLSTVNSEKAIVDNSEPVTVSLAGYYTITDAYDNVVFDKNGKNDKLYNFYGIESVQFGPDADITVADNIAGTENVRKPSALKLAISVSADGELTFQNTGAALVDNAYIIVPITIKHLWGTLKGNIAVPLEKKLGN